MNYQRPQGFEKEKRDCTVRALSLAGNLPYEKVHKVFKQKGRKDGHGVKAQKIFQIVCKSLDLVAEQVKRSGTINKLIEQYPKGNLFCIKRGHAFTIIDGIVHDEKNLNSHIKGAWLINKKESALI